MGPFHSQAPSSSVNQYSRATISSTEKPGMPHRKKGRKPSFRQRSSTSVGLSKRCRSIIQISVLSRGVGPLSQCAAESAGGRGAGRSFPAVSPCRAVRIPATPVTKIRFFAQHRPVAGENRSDGIGGSVFCLILSELARCLPAVAEGRGWASEGLFAALVRCRLV